MSKSRPQQARQMARDRAGKYVSNPCHLCGRGAPLETYYSDDRCNGVFRGLGLVLHAHCAARLEKMSDEEGLSALEKTERETA